MWYSLHKSSGYMKKKKFNYYNLFVYGFKFFTILALICGFFFVLSRMYSIDFWSYIFISLTFISDILMLLFINLTKKYENKITTYIDKPKKPRFYFVNVKSSSFLQYVEHCLLDFHYDKRIEAFTNHTYYYFEKFLSGWML